MIRFCIFAFVLGSAGCSLSARAAIEQLQDELESDSDSSGGDSSETDAGPPLPTTGTSTGGLTTGEPDPETTDLTGTASEIEILEFAASSTSIERARSIVFTAQVDGPVADLELRVHHPDRPTHHEPWPLEQPALEYIVNTDGLNGDVTFELVATSIDGDDASATIDASIQLPPSGTLDQRWTLGPQHSTTGTSIVTLAADGTDFDRVVAVGTQDDSPLLIELVDGELVTTPIGLAQELAIPRAAAVDGDQLYVGGVDEQGMFLRKVDLKTKAIVWSGTYPDARVYGLAVRGSEVFAVGDIDFEDTTWAAVWRVSESGGGDWTPAVLERFEDGFNLPLGSGLRGVVASIDHVVAVGFSEPADGEHNSSASLFEFVDGTIELRHADNLAVGEDSMWNAAVVDSNRVIHTSGWYRDGLETTATLGRFSADLSSEHLSLAWPGVATGVTARDELVGQRAGRFFAQGPLWYSPYTDDAGDESEATAVAVDRHGYVYVLGTFLDNGPLQLVLTRFSP